MLYRAFWQFTPLPKSLSPVGGGTCVDTYAFRRKTTPKRPAKAGTTNGVGMFKILNLNALFLFLFYLESTRHLLLD